MCDDLFSRRSNTDLRFIEIKNIRRFQCSGQLLLVLLLLLQLFFEATAAVAMHLRLVAVLTQVPADIIAVHVKRKHSERPHAALQQENEQERYGDQFFQC